MGSREASCFNPVFSGVEMKQAVFRSGGFTFLAQVIRQVIQLGATMVMGRLLLPEDFGLVAMVVGIIGILEGFKDVGLSAATVQHPDLDGKRVNALFWINLGLTVLLTGMLVFAAPVIGAFYGKPQLIGITIGLAVGFFAAGACVQQWALMRRHLRYGTLAVIETFGTVAGSLVAIGMAMAGKGYWAVVAMIVMPRLVNAVGAWVMCPWRPSWSVTFSGTGALLKFGWHLMWSQSVTTLARSLDVVLLGRFYGAHVTGLYSKAIQVRSLPSAVVDIPIQSIAVSALSRLQHDPASFRRAYQGFLYMIALLMFPFGMMTTLAPEALLRLILGPQWSEAASMTRCLGLLIFLQPALAMLQALFVAGGCSGIMLKWSICSAVIWVSGFSIGAFFGGVGMAVGYVVASVLNIVVGGLWAAKRFMMTPDELFGAARPAVLAAGAGIIAGGLAIILLRPSLRAGVEVEGCIWFMVAFFVYALVLIRDLRRKGYHRHVLEYCWRRGAS